MAQTSITTIFWKLHHNDSALTLLQPFGRAGPVIFRVPLSLCLPKRAALPRLRRRSSGCENGGITSWDCTHHQRCSRLQLTARATFSHQTPFIELVRSATFGTAERHSRTRDHWPCSSAGLFIVSSGAARQKAKWSTVSKSKSLKIPPETQEHTCPLDRCKRSLQTLQTQRREILCYGDHGTPAQLLQAPSLERRSEG